MKLRKVLAHAFGRIQSLIEQLLALLTDLYHNVTTGRCSQFGASTDQVQRHPTNRQKAAEWQQLYASTHCNPDMLEAKSAASKEAVAA